ncbi:MBL fold metallo-hydrolase [Bermanella marisrubri]|uniref:Zn-dependent Hydrolase, including glyoxylases n=1 Tax=Bermanella marisrubri TaxID=207949 RepID=Q1MYD8_9GAMM|nr:MBL fold metallo-hydrolase [Bermanella marisrubri]EAT11007.1 Zn-dependent Hydrolase, including glyoxylases [Oceanobacter sp. RED65] [Bermanella marisrubri]QIZ83748.1 MBL fold metallo-hydrolase [Bermanella marisrubri]
MALEYRIVPVTPFQQNCSIIWCSETKEAAVVDPGGDLHLIEQAVDDLGVQVKQVLLTHCHIDHAGMTQDVSEKHQVPIVGPQKEEQFWIDMLPQQAAMFNFPQAKSFSPDRWLEEGDEVKVGNETLSVLHCPGHTPGHVVFYNANSQLAIVGDVLFMGGIGRTDFPMGDHQTLINAIQQKLFALPEETQFIPGHGPMSTIGHEKRSNPFVKMYG